MMKNEFWVLVPKDLTDEKIYESLNKSIDDVHKFETKKEANEFKKYDSDCDKSDKPKKIRLTLEIIQ